MQWIIIIYLILGVYAVYDFNQSEGLLAHEKWKKVIAYLVIFFAGPVAIIIACFLNMKERLGRWQ